MSARSPYLELTGISASPGIAIGRAFVHSKELPSLPRRRVSAEKTEAEAERFLNTLHQAAEEIRRTRRLVATEHGEDLAQIFDAQLAMVNDVEMKETTLRCIREQHYPAERAFQETLEHMKQGFASIEDEFLRQRLSDLMDIEHQVLLRLNGNDIQALHSLRANTIVVAHDLLPSESAQLGGRMVKGIALDVGGSTSHAAIIARSLGLPTVLGAGKCMQSVQSGDVVIVDGNEGRVHIRPTDEVLHDYRLQLRRQQRRERDLSARRGLPAVTKDDHTVVLLANVDMPGEVDIAVRNGARGVGMFRTEYLFMGYQLPSEEEQVEAYSKIVKGMAPQPVTIRTMDLGGDKLAHVLNSSSESNPYLGWRGIRICLDTPDLFKTQLRAILRAGEHGEVRVLLPMISNLDELRTARLLLHDACDELLAEGLAFQQNCQLGVMVEVPSVALMADDFAQEADFLSLGTNDLIQYTLAVDRGNAQVAPLYDAYHPAVLRLIQMVADSGRERGVPVSVCGEIGGDPFATVLLLGLGVERLSMSPGLIPEVKEVIRSTTLSRAQAVAAQCLPLKTGAEVRDYLNSRSVRLPSGARNGCRKAARAGEVNSG